MNARLRPAMKTKAASTGEGHDGLHPDASRVARPSRQLLAAAAVLVLAGSSPGRAAAVPVLPPAYDIASLTANTIGDLDPNTNRVTENDTSIGYTGPATSGLTRYGSGQVAQPGNASASLSFVYSPAPAATVTAYSAITGVANPSEKPNPALPYGGFGTYEAEADANIHYSLEFLGPKPTVMIDIAALMQIGDSGYTSGSEGSASAGLNISDGPYDDNDFLDALFLDGLTKQTMLETIHDGVKTLTPFGAGTYTESGMFVFNTGELYDVTVSASAYALTLGSPTSGSAAADAFASIDPTFTIDAAMPDASAFQIVLSDGIGNAAALPVAAAVPEPPTIALFFGGVALASLGSQRLRRSRRIASRPSTIARAD